MSKSYKKFPIIKQEKTDKKDWNRRIRNLNIDYSLKGNQYKKFFSNYSKWQYRWSLDDAIKDYRPSKSFPTLDSWIEYWKRCCLRK